MTSNDLGPTASVTVTVRIDRTPPFVTISSPALNAVVPAGTLTIAGFAGDALSDVAVTCDGQAATMDSGAFTCDTIVPAMGATIVVRAIDVAGNTQTLPVEVITLDSITTEPTTLRLTPQLVTMVLGETRTFAVRDNLNRLPADAAWSVDNATVAALSTEPIAALKAMSAGQATLTVTWRGLTATTEIAVLGVSVAPAGTTRWSAPPIGGAVSQIMQATTMEGERRIYVLESRDLSSADTLRAFTKDGRELWSDNAGGKVEQLSGELLGGAVLTISPLDEGPLMLRVMRPDGRSLDQPATAKTFAIHPDGPLYMVSGSELVSIDIGLGAGGRMALPLGTATTCTGGTLMAPEDCESVPAVYGAGTPTVLADGRVVVPVDTSNQIVVGGPEGGIGTDPQISLAFLASDGSAQVQAVAIGDRRPWKWEIRPFKAIPNGSGGFLVGFNVVDAFYSPAYYLGYVIGVDASGSNTGGTDVDGWVQDLILGEQDTALAVSWNRAGPIPARRVITQLKASTGNAGAFPTLLPPSQVLTSGMAVQGGGFIISLSDGTNIGPSPELSQMHMAHARPVGDATWIGSLSGGLASETVVEISRADTDWPFSGGSEQVTETPPAACGWCLRGYIPPPGHGPAPPADAKPGRLPRRVITVAIDSSWNILGVPHPRVKKATDAAIEMWNAATDKHGERTGYFFKLDQGHDLGVPDITIVMKEGNSGSDASGWAFSDMQRDPSTNRSMFEMPSILLLPVRNVDVPTSTDKFIAARIAHEFAHKLGGVGYGACRISILRGSNPATGQRHEELACTVSNDDVQLINFAMNNPKICKGWDYKDPRIPFGQDNWSDPAEPNVARVTSTETGLKREESMRMSIVTLLRFRWLR